MEEEKDSLKQKVDELYEHYDEICTEKYNLFIHHEDLIDKLLPFIEQNVGNDVHRRMFNDKCAADQISFYGTRYVWTLQACIAKSFHSCFQLFSYVRMFRKLRKWGRLRVERTHLFGAIKFRILWKRKYCKKAETGNQPKGAAMKATYEFLQTFNEDMPDIADRRKLSREDEEENSRRDVRLIGKPFHGGKSPDILDLLVYGAIRGCQGLDIYNFLFRKREMENLQKWYTQMQDEVGRSSCKKHV